MTLNMKSRMKFLIESFYRSIAAAAPLPISYNKEILLTSRIMDAMFAQIYSPSRSTDPDAVVRV